MLANGITLSYGTAKGTYTKLAGLKEVPEFGIGDAGELEYKFAYKNDGANAPYRILRNAADNKTKLFFEQTYPDGTKVTFEGQVSVKLGGGGVNAVIEFTLKIALQSELTFVDGIGG